MSRILAISSHVTRGHVGLSAIVPALQALGHDVIALPTILLSNHPGHAHVAGDRIAPEQLRRMLDALAANGWLSDIDAVLTGYLPSVEHVAFAVDAIDRVRRANPAAQVLVDPVIGDHPKGLYIDKRAAAAIRDMLLPQAALVKLNAFELEWLTERTATSTDTVTYAALSLALPSVTVTSASGSASACITNLTCEAGVCIACDVARRPVALNGTGDLFGALLLGYRLNGYDVEAALGAATAAVDRVLAASAGRDEIALVDCLTSLADIEPFAVAALASSPQTGAKP